MDEDIERADTVCESGNGWYPLYGPAVTADTGAPRQKPATVTGRWSCRPGGVRRDGARGACHGKLEPGGGHGHRRGSRA